MLPLKKILCPVDFSEHSLKALDNAVELAGKFNAELHLINVIAPFPILPASPHPIGFDIQVYEDELSENSLESLEKLVAEKIPDSIKTTTKILKGDASTQIINYAHENKIDLITLSTHGTGALKHFLFGSVAEKVLRHSNCPVLTIRGY
ncbi:MAG: universal stress protein [Candidatus Marinimicrobia bacterium]|nr:universal stress protein [Candidatus Neomarinimicrobiota bacterium]